MRIVAGTHRGRPLESPVDARIRPTSDRIRESLFNILEYRLDAVEGRRVLDGFAGTGALGFEALSRGAERAVFMDNNRDALALCRRNATALGLAGRCDFQPGDPTRPPRAAAPCGLVFLDPPYGESLAAAALIALDETGWVSDDAVLVIEADRSRPEAVPAGFIAVDTREYGRTRIDIVMRAGTL
jgi:16S rRNA (guanine966-N2)-methyltransferase